MPPPSVGQGARELEATPSGYAARFSGIISFRWRRAHPGCPRGPQRTRKLSPAAPCSRSATRRASPTRARLDEPEGRLVIDLSRTSPTTRRQALMGGRPDGLSPMVVHTCSTSWKGRATAGVARGDRSVPLRRAVDPGFTERGVARSGTSCRGPSPRTGRHARLRGNPRLAGRRARTPPGASRSSRQPNAPTHDLLAPGAVHSLGRDHIPKAALSSTVAIRAPTTPRRCHRGADR